MESLYVSGYFPVPEKDEKLEMIPSRALQPVCGPALPDSFRELAPIFGPGVEVEVVASDGVLSQRGGPDFLVTVVWEGTRFEFAAEAKTRNTPRVLEEALRQSRRWAVQTGRMPMVIVPYLGEKRVERLLEEGVSGLDLCGNGLVLVPGRLLLRRTGQPNRYPESRPARFAYRGVTSLVPRVFLRRTEYSSVSQIKDEIEAAGGSVALSTVSKALARMTDDLIVDRIDERISLLQPDKLLRALVENFVAPEAGRVEYAKASLSLEGIFRRVAHVSEREGSRPRLRLTLSGASSQDRYAAGLRADIPTICCDNLDEFRRRLGDAWRPSERFPDFAVIETRDPTVYFDVRTDEAGVVFASPVQAYLDLAAGGEKRDTEMAEEIRSRILRDMGRGPANS